MAKDFKFSSTLIPAKARAKALQNVGNISGSVVTNVGASTESAATIVNNYITNTYVEQPIDGQIKGEPITIDNLLALTDAKELDYYQVFLHGSESGGWVFGEQYELNGEQHPSGTFVQMSAFGWQYMEQDLVDISNNAKFNPLQDNLVQIEELYQDSSIPMLSGATYNGIALAKVRAYELDDDKVYQKNNTQSSGERPASTNRHILFVPYASKNGTTYSGGALSAADYKKLCELESSGVTIDTELSEDSTDEHVPSSKVVWDKLSILGQGISGLYSSKANTSDLSLYVKTTDFNAELSTNYYTKSYLDVALSAIPTESSIEQMGFGKRDVLAIRWTKNTDGQSVFVKINLADVKFTLLGSTTDVRIDFRIANCTTVEDYENYFVKHDIRMIKRQANNGTLTFRDSRDIFNSASVQSNSDGVYMRLGINMSAPVNPTTGVPTYIYVICDKLV